MRTPRACVICRERRAVLPDRNVPGRPIKRLCKQCHVDRLVEDLKRIPKDRKE